MAEKLSKDTHGLLPRSKEEAEALVSRLNNDDLRTICSSFGLEIRGSQVELRVRLLQYYSAQLEKETTPPLPTPRVRRKNTTASTVSSESEIDIHGSDTDIKTTPKLPELSLPGLQRDLKESNERLSRVEDSIGEVKHTVHKQLIEFRQIVQDMVQDMYKANLTAEEVKPTQMGKMSTNSHTEDNKTLKEFDETNKREVDIDTFEFPKQFLRVNRRRKFLINNIEQVMSELDRLIQSKYDVKRVERQLTKLNELQTECLRVVEEIVAILDDEEQVQFEIEKWEDIRAQIIQAEDQAELYIERYEPDNDKQSSVKLPSLQLPKFSGNVLEWQPFYDAYSAAVHDNKHLSNVQKMTHLRSCLSGKAYRCIEGYAITNTNYEKALQDLMNRYGRRRIVINELVKSILSLEVPDKVDAKTLRYLYDTLKNRVRSLESNGMRLDHNESLVMVFLPIFEMKLPGELREKWELELSCNEDKEVNVDMFFQFLEKYVLSKEAREEIENADRRVKVKRVDKWNQRSSPRRKSNENDSVTSASALTGTRSENNFIQESKREMSSKCGFCSKEHSSVKCNMALRASPRERWDMLRRNKKVSTCFNCLQSGSVSHNSRTCKGPKCSVEGCGKQHHRLLHIDYFEKKEPIREEDSEVETSSGFVSSKINY